MSELYMIFDKYAIEEGNKIYQDTMENYKKIDYIIGSEELPRHGYGLYYFYPYLFKDDFDEIEDEKINIIGQSGIFCLENLLYFDRLIDNQTQFDINIIFQKNFLMQYSTKLLSILFKYDDEFWTYFEKYYKKYIAAIKMETENHYGIMKDFDYSEFSKIARGKLAVGKYPIAALGCLSGKVEKIVELEKSHDLFAEAFQLYDDLRDWKEDFNLKHYSWLLTKIIKENNLSEDCQEKELSNALFGGKYDVLVLDKINMLCEEAMLYAGRSNSWIRYIKYFQLKVNRLMFDLYSLRGNKLTSYIYSYMNNRDINELNLETEIKRIIKKSTEFLLKQQVKGYPEMTHWMAFPHSHGYTAEEECLECDVFWKAFALNLIYDINKMGFAFPEEVMNQDIEYLISRKSIYHTYGWSYCYNIPELPPDIDTLSEFIKLSTKFDKDLLKKGVEESINKALRCNKRDDNSFETYILDENDLSDASIKAQRATRNIYGFGASPEVNANFIHALALYDFDKYKDIIEKCIEWIIDQQCEEGFWDSSYYISNYYCGYICSKIFKLLDKNNKSAEKIYKYITRTQNLNGSWGENGGNPLDTSFAISSLVDLRDFYDKNVDEMIKKGLAYLVSTVNEGGYWTGCEFLAFGKGRKDSSVQMMRHRSSTLTTIVCTYGLSKGFLSIIQ